MLNQFFFVIQCCMYILCLLGRYSARFKAYRLSTLRLIEQIKVYLRCRSRSLTFFVYPQNNIDPLWSYVSFSEAQAWILTLFSSISTSSWMSDKAQKLTILCSIFYLVPSVLSLLEAAAGLRTVSMSSAIVIGFSSKNCLRMARLLCHLCPPACRYRSKSLSRVFSRLDDLTEGEVVAIDGKTLWGSYNHDDR